MIISKDRKLVVGLEIGTTKVVTLVGEILIDSTIKIIGYGTCISKGINKGRINDLNTVVSCIQESINKAEIMADCQITSVYLSLSNKYINCQNEIGIVPISEDEVTKEDVENVIHTAKSVKILNEHHILHVIPKEYSIDQQSGIKNPIGLSGVRMQVKAHLITCHENMSKNIIKAVEKCDLKVDQVIFSGLASSKAVLTKDERQLGVCMIDIGGGTIDFTVYIDDAIQYSQVIPYGGNIVTRDISYAFSTSYTDAENMKIKYGSAIKPILGESKNIDCSHINGNFQKNLQQDALIEVIESRYIELLSLVKNNILSIQKKLYKNGEKHDLLSGIVLTGGGSNIAFLTECAEKVFHKKVRIAKPLNISGLIEDIMEPNYATVVGLLHYGKELYINVNKKQKENSFIEKWFQKINYWFKKEF
ncbi:cell division protein FtsA [Buchnera aphidicola]|uniref:Cell division protein FtsA n=1 Tax=Buchnera aphidicola str. USDA (Myzus persicae) TaxID=1009856 RepID=W0P464_BUCMP|nr:cell division protein FtsA [Buchnera aphidicola]AHG60160.1 Ftsa [Buchnera aphidicola str. USDA (Myzus persicae)]AHG60739.1 Ftsa [Buchnera aphidicola str. W106 (Myzus persicae)]AHG61312.1 Ftsa [Buchnera aphidicola str. G002 (Myzus persicae)]AHG61885.1 Ftsa [Buchnera aphidicola str. F009 (Myzus persicae)]WAI03149.1 MAG: cell division protein FtsA [Buchnera aphidicola (Myzus persicae)]